MTLVQGPVFPTEIFEGIICRSSYSTLLTTAAVNGTFHLITRKYLFGSISLKRTIYDRDTVSRARTFLSLLNHVPDIARCVRRIHIDCFGENLLESDDFVPDTAPLITVLSRLQRLNSVSLRGRDSTSSPRSCLDWDAVCGELKQAFVCAFRSPLVCEIKLSHVYNLPFSIFVGCCSLKHLSLNAVSSRKSKPCHRFKSRPKLDSLVLRDSLSEIHEVEDLRSLFSPQGLLDISQLSEFVFSKEERGMESHTRPASILSDCAESIKSLELRLNTSVTETYGIIASDAPPLPLPPSPIDLGILPNLTKLIVVAKLTTICDGYKHIGYSEDDDGESIGEGTAKTRLFHSYSSPLPWLVARLEMLSQASNLSEIILRLNLSVTDNILKDIDWADLTRILSFRNLPNLNLVTLQVSGQYTALSPAQLAVLRSNQYLSALVDEGRVVLVTSKPF